jgi:hypothetical protein
VPLDGGARKKDHQEAWAIRCLFIGAGAVSEQTGLWDLNRTLALSYFLLRGILCPKGISSISFCRRERIMILEAWSSETGCDR